VCGLENPPQWFRDSNAWGDTLEEELFLGKTNFEPFNCSNNEDDSGLFLILLCKLCNSSTVIVELSKCAESAQSGANSTLTGMS
jgi:hypothetical protein